MGSVFCHRRAWDDAIESSSESDTEETTGREVLQTATLLIDDQPERSVREPNLPKNHNPSSSIDIAPGEGKIPTNIMRKPIGSRRC